VRTSSVDVLMRKMPRQGAILGRASVIQITGDWVTVEWLGAELSIPYVGSPVVDGLIWLLQQGTVIVGIASGGGGAGGSVAWGDITGKPATFPPTEQPLDWLTDVDAAAPVTGQVLGYDGAAWVARGIDWADIGGLPSTFTPTPQPLNWLTDVYVGSPIAGQVLGYDGSSWAPLDVVASADWSDITGKPADFPPTPQALDWLTDASSSGAIDGKLLGFSAGQWVPVAPPVAVGGVAPVGTVMMWGATTVPIGWLNCDGQAVNRITYSDLFSVIGTTWGVGDGSTTFNVPNLSQRFPLGATTPGASGGAWDHTHTQPTHTHTGPSHTHTTSAAGNHDHGSIGGATTNIANASGQRTYVHNASTGERHTHEVPLGGSHDHGSTGGAGTGATGASGGDDTGANNPPYLSIVFIIKATPGGADSGETTIDWADITGKPTSFLPIAQAISWLTDVDTAGVTEDQVLTMKSGQWVGADPTSVSAVDWAAITGKPTLFPPVPQALDWLTDVDAAAPSPGQVLGWDGTKWAPVAGGGSGGTVDWADITGKPTTFPPTDHGNTTHTTPFLPLAGGPMTGDIDMNNNRVTFLPMPTGLSQPLTTQYGYSIEAVGLGPTIHIGTGTPSGGRDNDVWIQR